MFKSGRMASPLRSALTRLICSNSMGTANKIATPSNGAYKSGEHNQTDNGYGNHAGVVKFVSQKPPNATAKVFLPA